MSWVSPKVRAYHQKTLHGRTGGRHLQGTGMSYSDMPIGLKPEQQNNFVCRAFCVLRKAAYLYHLRPWVGFTHAFVPSRTVYPQQLGHRNKLASVASWARQLQGMA